MAAALVVAGCATERPGGTEGNAALGAVSDTNPHDRADLAPGGNLRLAIGALPENFNTLHIDGNNAETAAMLRATRDSAAEWVSGPPLTDSRDAFSSETSKA